MYGFCLQQANDKHPCQYLRAVVECGAFAVLADTLGSKEVGISWYGSEEGKDIFASPSKLNFSASTAQPAITDDIL